MKSHYWKMHCVKSIQMQSFFWSVFSCIRIRKNSVSGHFSRSGAAWKWGICISLLIRWYLFKNYLSDSTHRKSYSPSSDLLIGVPQGSILGPLLFNVCIYNLFFFTEDETLTSHTDLLLLSLTELMYSQFLNGSRYSRMDQVKFMEEKL